jgi:uncharacterized protein (TIGR02757 family)
MSADRRRDLEGAYERFKRYLGTTSALAAARSYEGSDQDLWALLVALSDYQVQGVLLPMLLGLSDYLRASGESVTEAITSDRASFYSFQWKGHPGYRGWYHRFLTGDAFEGLLDSLSSIVKEEGSITKLAHSLYGGDVAKLIFSLAREIRARARTRVKGPSQLSYIAPDPDAPKRSTMKTLTLYLRWMARKEYPDLGLWDFVDACQLYPSIGRGTARTINRVFEGRDEGRLRTKSLGWKDVEEARKIMREINPDDPAKYDYVFSRPSMMGYCSLEFEERKCEVCPLSSACRASNLPHPHGQHLRSKDEDKIFERFEEKIRPYVNDVNADIIEEFQVNGYSADAVIRFKNGERAVVEVERELNHMAVGQVVDYQVKYESRYDEEAKAIVVVERARDEKLIELLKSERGIEVILVRASHFLRASRTTLSFFYASFPQGHLFSQR